MADALVAAMAERNDHNVQNILNAIQKAGESWPRLED